MFWMQQVRKRDAITHKNLCSLPAHTCILDMFDTWQPERKTFFQFTKASVLGCLKKILTPGKPVSGSLQVYSRWEKHDDSGYTREGKRWWNQLLVSIKSMQVFGIFFVCFEMVTSHILLFFSFKYAKSNSYCICPITILWGSPRFSFYRWGIETDNDLPKTVPCILGRGRFLSPGCSCLWEKAKTRLLLKLGWQIFNRLLLSVFQVLMSNVKDVIH